MNFSNVNDWIIKDGSVVRVVDSLNRVIWEKVQPQPATTYFYIEDVSGSDNTITIRGGLKAPSITIYCSTDQINWTNKGTATSQNITVTVPAYGKVYFKAIADTWCYTETETDPETGMVRLYHYYNKFDTTGRFNVGGNIMSLLYGDNFENQTSFPSGSTNTFYGLFRQTSSNLINAYNLALPATTLVYCCYRSMFYNCRALTTAPALPATTLASTCYDGMFYQCTSLTTAPVLPAPTLTERCYDGMFWGCSSLNSVTTYAQDISATDCLNNWLHGVAATGTFNNMGSASYQIDSADGIPTGWTAHNYVPFYVEDISGSSNTLSIVKSSEDAPTIEVYKSEDGTNWESMGSTSTTAITATIPANGRLYLKATAAVWCSNFNYNLITASGNHNVGGNTMSLLYGNNYEAKTSFPASSTSNFMYLFYNSTTLVNASKLILPAHAITNYGYQAMFDGCTNLTTPPVLPATSVNRSSYGTMFYGCTSLTTAPALPATNLNVGCYSSMFSGCTSLTQAPALPATTLVFGCYNWMFSRCTGIVQTPHLHATTLVQECYRKMFNGCTNLKIVNIYAQDISATDCLQDWLGGVSSTGDFYNGGNATYPSGTSGIPTGWTEHTNPNI